MFKNPTHSRHPLGEFFGRWPFGHGGYARQALSEACTENGVKADKAELIAASLFARGFSVVADDFLALARGDSPKEMAKLDADLFERRKLISPPHR